MQCLPQINKYIGASVVPDIWSWCKTVFFCINFKIKGREAPRYMYHPLGETLLNDICIFCGTQSYIVYGVKESTTMQSTDHCLRSELHFGE